MTTSEHDQARSPLTSAARRGLEEELEQLYRQREEAVATMRIEDDPGDSGDQAQTIEAADRLTRIDDRIAGITRRLETGPAAAEPPGDTVAVGSRVTLRYPDGTTVALRVGDVVEATGEDDVTTPGSPLGRALLGHGAGDTVTYEAPGGRLSVQVVETAAEPRGPGDPGGAR